MEDSSRTYDAEGNRTDNTDRPRNISRSVQAEIAARRQASNQNVVPRAAANANENQGQLPREAAPNNNIPSPSPTGVNTFFSGSCSPEFRATDGNISVTPGFIPPGFEPAADHQPTAPVNNQPAAPVNNAPQAAAQPLPMDFATIMAQMTQQLSTSLQTMQQQIKRDNEEAIKRQFEALKGKITAETSANPQPPIDSVHITANSSSKKSYASASKTHADDETFDSASKNTSASSNPPKAQPKSQPIKRGIPAPMASSIPTGSKGPSLPEKTALCVKAISYVGNIKHARAETDHTDICFVTVGRAFISALELVDSSKSFSLLRRMN
jgi:hypothetical protein